MSENGVESFANVEPMVTKGPGVAKARDRRQPQDSGSRPFAASEDEPIHVVAPIVEAIESAKLETARVEAGEAPDPSAFDAVLSALRGQVAQTAQQGHATRYRCAIDAAEDAAAKGDLRRTISALEQARSIAKNVELHAADLVLGARALNGQDIFAPLPPTPWLVQDLQWCPGRPSMLLGFGSSGKTLAAQSAGLSLVAERPIWGWFLPSRRPARVIHLDLEQGQRATRKRYQRLGLGLGLTPEEQAEAAERLQLVPFPRVYLNSQGAEDAYKRAVDGFDFCILDALRGATPGIDENDSQIRKCIDILGPVSEATGCTFLLIHHAGKGFGEDRDDREMGRGSSAIFDACGSTISIAVEKGDGDELRRRVKMTKGAADGEGVRLDPFYLAFVDVPAPEGQNPFAGVRVEYKTEEQVKGPPQTPGDRLAAVKRRVLDFIQGETREGRPVHGRAAVRSAVGAREVDVAAAVEALIADGLIKDRPEKTGRGGSKPRFWAVVRE